MNLKTIKSLSTMAIIGCAMLTSCSSSAEKVNNAEEAVTDAEVKLQSAYAAYVEDLENHRLATRIAIEENKKLIEAYKVSIAKDKKEVLAEKTAKINELELQNADLEAKNDAYNADESSNWENFKAEFKRDMDQLGESIRNLTNKDKKS